MRQFAIGKSPFDESFQSTHSVWNATETQVQEGGEGIFQSTHSVWNASSIKEFLATILGISIHAFRMECDSAARMLLWHYAISIHAFRMECDTAETLAFIDWLFSIHAFRMECDSEKQSFHASFA
ncbi:hypothetical protein PA598K_05976 [Paenibacillus sp. 598K]|nr:hypothetical protein PA598K_05976 [Paenibacillus sp. 598K]